MCYIVYAKAFQEGDSFSLMPTKWSCLMLRKSYVTGVLNVADPEAAIYS